jgi:hypothetical protein
VPCARSKASRRGHRDSPFGRREFWTSWAQPGADPTCAHPGVWYVESVVFSPDGRYLAVGTWGGSSVQLIDTSSWQVIRTFEGHTSAVNSVAFSPDGKLLASGSWDMTIKLWEVATGQEVRTLKGHTGLGLFRGVQPRREAPRLRLLGHDDQAVGGGHRTEKCAPSKATPAWAFPWRSAPTGSSSPPAPGTRRSSCGMWPQEEKCAPSKATPGMSLPWRSAPTGSSSPPAPLTGHDQAVGGGHRTRSAHPQRPHRLCLVRGVQPRRASPRLRLL